MNLLVNIDEINHYQVFYQDKSVLSARSSSHTMLHVDMRLITPLRSFLQLET
jgi:hypothetical protein